MTFAEAKAKFPTYGSAIGGLLNFTLARAFLAGKWSGTIASLRVAIYDFDDSGITRRQFTLPREAQTALGIRFENVALDGKTSARPIHNQWYSWLNTRCNGEWNTGIIDLGDHWQTFRDIPANAYLRIRTDYAETGTFYIRGTDSTGATIYSGTVPNVIEGTSLDLATNPDTTTETFLAGSTVQIVKPVTSGPVRLYSYDGTTETLLATYAPGETVPAYRRYQVAGASVAWTTSQFDYALVKAKRRFVELVADNDLVFPNNEVAIYFGLKAKNYEDKHDSGLANEYLAKFYDALNGELREEQGNAPVTIKLRTGEGYGSIRLGY
jgi:hypothetical protein